MRSFVQSFLGIIVLVSLPSAAMAAEHSKSARTDLHGDPLPPGAVARLGCDRFQHSALEVLALAYSPDGKVLASAGGERLILWDSATGKRLRQFALGSCYRIALAFTSEGNVVVLATRGTSGLDENKRTDAVLFQPEVKDSELRLALEEGCWLGALAFSADGKRFLAAGDKTLALWDAVQGKLIRQIPIDKRRISALALSPDYRFAACLNGGRRGIYLQDLRTQKIVREWSNFSGEDIGRLAFSPDGKKLFAAGPRRLRVWDIGTGKEQQPLGEEKDYRYFSALTVAPDGKTLATAGSFQAAISLWDLETARERRPLTLGTDYLRALAYADGKTVITITNLGVACFWDAESGKCLRQLGGEGDAPRFFAVSRQGTLLAGCTPANRLVVWDVAARKARWQVDSPFSKLDGLRFSSDGRILIGWEERKEGKKICYWDVATAKPLSPIPDRDGACVPKVSADGTIAAVENYDSWTVQLYRVRSSRPWQRLGLPIKLSVYERFHDLSPDGRILLVKEESIGKQGRLGFVYRETGDRIYWLGSGGDKIDSRDAVFSADGRTVASTHSAGAVRLWDVATRQEVERFVGHEYLSTLVAFSPDGRHVASEGFDHNVLIWKRQSPPVRSERTRSAGVDLDDLWRDLASANAEVGQRAARTLTSSPARAVPYLKAHFLPAPRGDGRRFRSLAADLDSDSFAVREKAHQELAKEIEQAEDALEEALQGKPSLELRRRVLELLDKQENARCERSPENLRTLRAVQVLEAIGTSEARRVLTALSDGAPGALRTQEARMALRRLEQAERRP